MATLIDDAIGFVASEDKPARIDLIFGQLSTTYDDTTIEDTNISAALNAYRDEKTTKLEMRPRQWCNGIATTTSVIGCAFASLQNTSECERIVLAVQNGSNFEFKTANVASSVGSATNAYGASFGTATGTGTFASSWQHLNRVYFAGMASYNVYSISSLCGTAASSQMFKTKPFSGAQLASLVSQAAASDYAVTFSSWGTDTIGSNRGATGTMLSAGRTCRWSQATVMGTPTGTINVDYDPDDNLTIENNQLIWICNAEVNDRRHQVDATYIWQTAQDWRGVSVITVKYSISPNADILALNFRTSDGSGQFIVPADFTCYIKSGATEVQLEQMDTVWVDTTTVYVTYDARSMTEALRETVSQIRFYHYIIKDGGAGWQGDHLINLYKGGETYNLQTTSIDRLDKTTTPDRPVVYYLRYRNSDSTLVSRAIQNTVDPANHKGVRIHADLPKMGGTIGLTALAGASPWVSADYMDVYRVVNVQTTGETRYYKVVNGAANSGPYTWTDYYCDQDLLNSAVPYLTSFDVNGSLLGGTDPATGITCGTSWKGANVLGDSAGFIYTSRVGTHDDFAWMNGDYPFDPDALDDPRTEQVTNNGLAIQGLVGGDALYIFSRYQVYVIVGNTPCTANAAQRITDAGGLLAPRACCRMGSGALYASDNGLYFVQAPFYAAGGAQELQFEELTKDIRATWDWIKGSDYSNMTVTHYDNVIHVINGARILKMTKEATWSPMAFDTGATLLGFSGFHHPKYGMQVVSTTGKVGVMGWYPTDWGTNLAGTNGTAATWQVTSKKWVDFVRATRMQLLLNAPDSSTNLAVTVTTDRGSKSFTISGTSYRYNSFVPTSALPPAGRWVQISLVGSASTELQTARMEIIPADPRMKN